MHSLVDSESEWTGCVTSIHHICPHLEMFQTLTARDCDFPVFLFSTLLLTQCKTERILKRYMYPHNAHVLRQDDMHQYTVYIGCTLHCLHIRLDAMYILYITGCIHATDAMHGNTNCLFHPQ